MGMGASPRRIRSLDGLRGYAALVVVIHHVVMTTIVGATTYALVGSLSPSQWRFWLTKTPLVLGWAGTEAVTVFFVLSGFVLMAFAEGNRSTEWVAYYPRRMIRLVLPCLGAVLFAYATLLIVHRTVSPQASEWLNGVAVFASNGQHVALSDATKLDPPLWSLVWEIVFSLLLPVYVVAAVRGRRLLVVKVVAVLASAAYGAHTGSKAVTFLPMFLLGVLLYVEHERLASVAARMSTAWWTVATVVALGFTVSHFLLPLRIAEAANVLSPIGATLLVWVTMFWRPAVRAGETRFAQWLGRLSFSLYLVHAPIIIAVANLTDNFAVKVLVCLPLSLLAAELFARICEMPAHRLSQWAGRYVNARLDRHRSMRKCAGCGRWFLVQEMDEGGFCTEQCHESFLDAAAY